MSTLAAYYDYVMPELPGITPQMLDFHIRQTAREFCNRTSVWRQALDAVDTVAGQATYTLTMPTDAALVRLTRLSVNGELLWIDVEPKDDEDPTYTRNNAPFSLSNDLTQITLITEEIPEASVTDGLAMTAALQPTNAATTLPDFLLNQYVEAMRMGILYRLMLMPKKPWGDRALAMDYESRFNALVNHAAYQGDVGNTRKPLRVKSWG